MPAGISVEHNQNSRQAVQNRGPHRGREDESFEQEQTEETERSPHDALPAGASLLPLLPPFPPVQPAFLSVLCGLAV